MGKQLHADLLCLQRSDKAREKVLAAKPEEFALNSGSVIRPHCLLFNGHKGSDCRIVYKCFINGTATAAPFLPLHLLISFSFSQADQGLREILQHSSPTLLSESESPF